MEKNNTDSSQPEVNEGREGSLSVDKGTFSMVLTVRPLSLEDMDLVEPSDLPPPATGSKDQLEALEVASTSQGVSGVEKMRPGTASRHSGTPSPDLQVEAKASLGSVAAEVIEAVIGNVLAARAALQEEAQGPVFSSVSYFLSAVCADVQTLPLLRTSGSSSRSSGRSLGELLTTMSRTNVVQAVELKLEEQFGPCRKEGSSKSPSSQGQTEDLVLIPYLGSGRYGHSMASDLVEEIIKSIKSAVELLESQSSTSRAGNRSSLTGWDALDVSSAAKKMVCKAAAKLTPLVSSSRMGDVTADESVSLMNETSLESLPPSLIRLLLIRSVDTVTAACRAISSEFCYRESVKNEGLTKLQELANEQMLACLNKGIEEVEIDELIEGISAILDHSLILRRPELSFSHIYRSLFVDTLLPGSGHRTTEVQETLIFLCPQGSPAAGHSNDTRVGEIIKEYATKGKDLFQQAMRRATQKLSRQPSNPHGSPHAVNPESPERPSLLVSSENCGNLLGVILDDLHEVVEQHKASTKIRSGGIKFWEQVHSSSQLLYDSTLTTLQRAADKLSALEDRAFQIIPPIPSRQELIQSFAESSVKGQLQKSLEVNLPSTSSLACQESPDRTVRILMERVMDTLCESGAAAPCPGEDLGELSPAAVIDAGTASTSSRETKKQKKRLNWWNKKAKLFKNKFLKRKTEPKKPSAQEELPPSSHVTPGAMCGSPANLEQSKDHKTNQEPPRRPLHVRMFRALQKSIVKTLNMSWSQ